MPLAEIAADSSAFSQRNRTGPSRPLFDRVLAVPLHTRSPFRLALLLATPCSHRDQRATILHFPSSGYWQTLLDEPALCLPVRVESGISHEFPRHVPGNAEHIRLESAIPLAVSGSETPGPDPPNDIDLSHALFAVLRRNNGVEHRLKPFQCSKVSNACGGWR